MDLRPLKNSLREANTILQPPNPLPTTPVELAKRLGIKTSFTHTTEGLQLLVGKRCLALLEEIQEWLKMEYWPVSERGGLVASDFLLGTADLRLIRSLCSHVIEFLLLPVSIEFHKTSPDTTEHLRDELHYAIVTLLEFLIPAPALVTAPGPSTRRPNLPPTVITQTLVGKHLPYIYLSTTLLIYAPTIERSVYVNTRQQLSRTWHRLPPALVISALGAAIRLRRIKVDDGDQIVKGWNRNWPTYVPGRLGWAMAAVVRAPGGIRAIMENIFGENAILQNGRGVDTNKLDMVARAVTENPSPFTPARTWEWVPQTIDRLFEIIQPLPGLPPSPPLFINAACYCVFRLYLSHYWEVTSHLDTVIRVPLRAYMRDRKLDSIEQYIPPPDLVRAAVSIRALSVNTPFDESFIDYLVGEYLIALVSLRHHLIQISAHPDALIEISTPTADKVTTEAKTDIADLPETIRQLVVTWARDVELDTGIDRVIEAVRSGYTDVNEIAEMIMEADRPELPRAIVKRIMYWAEYVAGEEGRRINSVRAEEKAEAESKKVRKEQADQKRMKEEESKKEEEHGEKVEAEKVVAEAAIVVEDGQIETDTAAVNVERTIDTLDINDEKEEDGDYKESDDEEQPSEEEDDGASVRDELNGDLKTPSMEQLAELLSGLLDEMSIDMEVDTSPPFKAPVENRNDLTNHAMRVHREIVNQPENRF